MGKPSRELLQGSAPFVPIFLSELERSLFLTVEELVKFARGALIHDHGVLFVIPR